MKISNALLISGIVTVVAIVLANVIAIEYRINREKKEKLKTIDTNGHVCPPCPVCENQTVAT